METLTGNPTADWITVEEAADILGRKPRAVHNHADAGRLQVQRVGRRHLFLRAEVAALATELTAADALAERPVLAERPGPTPQPAESPALALALADLHAQIADLRYRMDNLAGTSWGTQLLIQGIEGELARRATWPTELELRAALVEVTAERDMLRARLGRRNHWWNVAGAVMVIVGFVIILVIALIALGILPRP